MTVALSKLNFRDLGGLPTEGGTIRPGRLYRSEGPANFDIEHATELHALGIRLIVDLRAQVECEKHPHEWQPTARIMNLDMNNDLRTETNEGWNALRDDPSEAGAIRAMTFNYAAMPIALHPWLAPLANAMLEDGLPVMIHCTAGKDRTGVLVALLLKLLSAPHEAIVADYHRSDVFAQNLRMGGSIADAFEKTFGFTPSQATIDAMIGVNTAFLDAALAAIDQQWGSLDAYFVSAGVTPQIRSRLRSALVDPAT
jgi:protein-tyrosine phosphatase